MYTQQDRAKCGQVLKEAQRGRVSGCAFAIREIAERTDPSVNDVLLDLADQLDQIAMPIVVERKS